MMYPSPSQIGTWNGWTEPVPPAPTIPQIHQGLMEEIDRELQPLPIRQQTVIVAVRHEEEESWTVDILNAPPPRGKYDTWTAGKTPMTGSPNQTGKSIGTNRIALGEAANFARGFYFPPF